VARILDQAEAQLTLFQPPGIRPTISKQAGPLKINALIGYGKGAQTAPVKGWKTILKKVRPFSQTA
jgi:hypothetical protein